jgi:hypothetical protein
MAYVILVRSDRARLGRLIEEIENDYLKGHENYPRRPQKHTTYW